MSENQLAAVHVIVRGYVQGVYFRNYTETKAYSLGLTGFVCNLPDGRTVEVRAEGERRNLEKLVGYLKVGPPHARVEKVETEWAVYSGSYAAFSIK